MKKLFPTVLVSFALCFVFNKMLFFSAEWFWLTSFVWLLLYIGLFWTSDYSACTTSSGEGSFLRIIIKLIADVAPAVLAGLTWFALALWLEDYGWVLIGYAAAALFWIIYKLGEFFKLFKKSK